MPVDAQADDGENKVGMATVKAVEFRAEVRQVKTMADRSVNVILNLPEDCIEQAKVLMDWLGLEVGAVIVSPDDHINGEEMEYGDKRARRKIRKGA